MGKSKAETQKYENAIDQVLDCQESGTMKFIEPDKEAKTRYVERQNIEILTSSMELIYMSSDVAIVTMHGTLHDVKSFKMYTT